MSIFDTKRAYNLQDMLAMLRKKQDAELESSGGPAVPVTILPTQGLQIGDRLYWDGTQWVADNWAKQAFRNLLLNGSFEDPPFYAPPHWTLTGGGVATFWRSPTHAKLGTYSGRLQGDGVDNYVSQGVVDTYYRGRTVSLGCWVYATVVHQARIDLYDGSGIAYSPYHSGTAGWEWLTVSMVISSSASAIYAWLVSKVDTAPIWFDGAIMLEGPIVTAYMPAEPILHASKHQDGGTDEISVVGLSGHLADLQDAQALTAKSENVTIDANGQITIPSADSCRLIVSCYSGLADNLDGFAADNYAEGKILVLYPSDVGGAHVITVRADSGTPATKILLCTGSTVVLTGWFINMVLQARGGYWVEVIRPGHPRLHSIISTLDHSSDATSGRILKANASGLAIEATNTDTDVADAVTKKHAEAHTLTSHTTKAHSELTDVGTNTHAQIDTHLAAASPHSGHAIVTSGYYTGDGTQNREIAHGLGRIPKQVDIIGYTSGATTFYRTTASYANHLSSVGSAATGAFVPVLSMNSTRFCVGDESGSALGANLLNGVYEWVAIG